MGPQDYWDKRYAAVQESYDWYLNYSGFKDLLPPDITKRDAPTRAASRVLVLGCGSSSERARPPVRPVGAESAPRRRLCGALLSRAALADMAEELYDDGYREVISIDFSKVVIEKMQQAAAKLGRKELKCTCCLRARSVPEAPLTPRAPPPQTR
jgi:SAM-dependent methyltransferase